MDKVKELQRASTISWYISLGFSALYVSLLTRQFVTNELFYYALAFGITFPIQYIFTLFESSLIDGSIPAFWRINWKEGGMLPVLYVFAFLCVIIDTLLNIGGVSFFFSKLHEVDIGQELFGMNSQFVALLTKFFQIAFSIMLTFASEVFKGYAKYLTDNVKRPVAIEVKKQTAPNIEVINLQDEQRKKGGMH